jgi:YbgC/YbaW family acyl-CoA thioester hydrolase
MASEAAFRYARRVAFAETDMEGIVHFSAIFRYMEEAEHALWRASGLVIAGPGLEIGWPRVSVNADFKSPLRFEDEFLVAIRIAASSRRTIQYGHHITRGDITVASGLITTACIAKQPDGGMKAIDLPPGLVDRLQAAIDASRE